MLFSETITGGWFALASMGMVNTPDDEIRQQTLMPDPALRPFLPMSIIDWKAAGFALKQWARTKAHISSELDLPGDGDTWEWKVSVERQSRKDGFLKMAGEWYSWWQAGEAWQTGIDSVSALTGSRYRAKIGSLKKLVL